MTELDVDVEKLRAGDEVALSALFEYLSPRIRRFVASRGASELDADEVISEVLLHLFRDPDRLADLASKGSLNAYCFHLARNVVVHHMRRFRKEEGHLSLVEDRAGQPIDESVLLEARQAVEAALAGLDDQSRRLVTMRYFEERSAAEIAETLGVSASAVRIRLHRVMRRLQEALHADGESQ